MNDTLRTLLEQRLAGFPPHRRAVAVLTGAGISAESGIPTFRGPEGYWRVGSAHYRPEEMATLGMFRQAPWEVWAWYLYRAGVCRAAAPNPGHDALVELEQVLGDRFRLITQNVDGLHLRAGNTPGRTYQIHGNLNRIRCAAGCSPGTDPLPDGVRFPGRDVPLSERQRAALACPRCGGLTRPHVLWFDECYDEPLLRAESALRWAARADLLLVVGTSGATSLPMQIGRIFLEKPGAVLIDVNPDPNPFQALAEAHPGGVALQGPSGEILPELLAVWRGAGTLTPTEGSALEEAKS